MDRNYRVYHSGSQKWIRVPEDTLGHDLEFVTDETSAAVFTIHDLRMAPFWEFSIYKETLHAIPFGTNCAPIDCATVRTTIRDYKDRQQLEEDGYVRC